MQVRRQNTDVADHTVTLGLLSSFYHTQNSPPLLNNVLTLLELEAVPFAFSFDWQKKTVKHDPFLKFCSHDRWQVAWDSKASFQRADFRAITWSILSVEEETWVFQDSQNDGRAVKALLKKNPKWKIKGWVGKTEDMATKTTLNAKGRYLASRWP